MRRAEQAEYTRHPTTRNRFDMKMRIADFGVGRDGATCRRRSGAADGTINYVQSLFFFFFFCNYYYFYWFFFCVQLFFFFSFSFVSWDNLVVEMPRRCRRLSRSLIERIVHLTAPIRESNCSHWDSWRLTTPINAMNCELHVKRSVMLLLLLLFSHAMDTWKSGGNEALSSAPVFLFNWSQFAPVAWMSSPNPQQPGPHPPLPLPPPPPSPLLPPPPYHPSTKSLYYTTVFRLFLKKKNYKKIIFFFLVWCNYFWHFWPGNSFNTSLINDIVVLYATGVP